MNADDRAGLGWGALYLVGFILFIGGLTKVGSPIASVLITLGFACQLAANARSRERVVTFCRRFARPVQRDDQS